MLALVFVSLLACSNASTQPATGPGLSLIHI